jgi:hypothetical protein
MASAAQTVWRNHNFTYRGRFSLLFSGISFNRLLSRIWWSLVQCLLLNTQDEPDQNKTEISLMTVGLGIGNTWKKSSLSVNANYINLAPYRRNSSKCRLEQSFQSLSGETVYRYNFNNGILKVYAAFDSSKFDINQESINC